MVSCARHGAAGEVQVHGTGSFKLYEKLQGVGRRASDELEAARKSGKKLDEYHATLRGELTIALSAFCSLDTRCSTEQWKQLERMIDEAVEFPYPTYRPLMKSNLVIIFASLK